MIPVTHHPLQSFQQADHRPGQPEEQRNNGPTDQFHVILRRPTNLQQPSIGMRRIKMLQKLAARASRKRQDCRRPVYLSQSKSASIARRMGAGSIGQTATISGQTPSARSRRKQRGNVAMVKIPAKAGLTRWTNREPTFRYFPSLATASLGSEVVPRDSSATRFNSKIQAVAP
jgi:hypothetical protein